EFFEGGINLSLLGLGAECFASTLAESRSSTSTTAVLKDFILGPFAKCDSTTVTTPLDGAGNAIPAGGLSIGTGSVSVKDQAVVTVNGTDSFGGTVTFYLCGPIAASNPSQTCDGKTNGGTKTVPALS